MELVRSVTNACVSTPSNLSCQTPSPCTANSDSARFLLIATTRSPALSTWNSCCNLTPLHSILVPHSGRAFGQKRKLMTQRRGFPMKKLLILFAFAALTVSASAADSKTITYRSGDETVTGILYTPQAKGPFPALIVIHEWWGLNDWVKEQASKLADQPSPLISIAAKLRPRPMKRTRLCEEFRKTAPSATCTLRSNILPRKRT